MSCRKTYIYLLLSFLFINGFVNNVMNAQLIINEIMASNANILYDDNYYNFPDWIEIKNNGSQASSGFYYISDDKNDLKKGSFQQAIDPGEHYIIYCDNEWGNGHVPFELDNAGEMIYLSDFDGKIMDSVNYGSQYTDISYGRSPQDGTWLYCAKPTPGTDNIVTNATQRAFEPYFSSPAGFYKPGHEVDIYSGLDQATIHYSTDGAVPGTSYDEYKETLNINTTKVLKTKAFASGWLPSETVANTYFINEPDCSIPVLSLSMNPDYLWDSQIGIYVAGSNGIIDNCSEGPRNWNQNWERAAYMEYWDENDIRQIAQPIGVKVSGGCSRQSPQKTLSIYARGKYGDNDLDYPFFKSKPHQTEYRSLFLRNSGNDWNYTMLRDAAIQITATDGMDLDYQGYQPVRVYINGEFFGLMNFREKLDEDYFYHNYNMEDDSIDFLEGNYNNSSSSVIRGSNKDFQSMVNYADNNDLSIQSNYEQVVEQIDLEEYINYMITHIYVANTDWPGNNIKYWRPDGGKWRWIVYDTDFGFSLYEDLSTHQTLHFATEQYGPDWPNPPWSTLFFRNLLQNESFRQQFAQTMLTHINTTFHPDRFNQIVDSLANMISHEMELFKLKYDGNFQDWQWEVDRLKSASTARFNFMPGYVASYFELNGPAIPLSVTHHDKTKGDVKVNNVYITHSPLIMNSYSGLPYSIEAIPASGYEFDHWITTGISSSKSFIDNGSIWKYNDSITDYPLNWTSLAFNDANWNSGSAQLGYGDGDEATILDFGSNPDNKRITYLFRKAFSGIDTTDLQELKMNILVDDGAVVYLNGQELDRINMPAGNITTNTFAASAIANENGYQTIDINKEWVNSDTNIIAVELHQISQTSSDISLDMDLSGTYFKSTEPEVYSTNRVLHGVINEPIAVKPVFKNTAPVNGLTINELASASQYFLDNHNHKTDFIEIYNNTDHDINMAGMYLSDDPMKPDKFKIPSEDSALTTVSAKDFVVFYADGSPREGVRHTNFNLDKDGEFIGLYQKIGNEYQVMDSLTYPFLQTNYSYGRFTDGSDNWHFMSLITAGLPNSLDEPNRTHIDHFTDEPTIQIYPNPAQSNVHIVSDPEQSNQSKLFLEIYNLQGKLAYPRLWLNQSEIQLSLHELENGVYLVKIFNEDRNYMQTQKLILLR